jgi:flap endonuclease-1
MGIHKLNDFLRKNCPDIFEEIHISEYAFKKIAIDISLYMYKFKVIYGNKWLTAFLNLIACLRKNEIHCVFIYDTSSPEDKADERAERAEKREQLEKKIFDLDQAIEHYNLTNEVNEYLLDFYNKKIKKSSPPRLLSRTNKTQIDIEQIKEWIEKTRNQLVNISSEDFELTRTLFDILSVPYYKAPVEAETMCSDLCKRNMVDAVLSEDTDVMAYACPNFLSKIDTAKETCIRINYTKMLEMLSITQEQFLDLCIMCGCDYNKNIYKIGPEKAFGLIKKYSSIEGIKDNTSHDISVLRHERVRELFTKYEQSGIDSVSYCGHPDFDVLTKFITDNSIKSDIEYLKKCFIHNVVVFEEDSEDDMVVEI